MATFNMGYRYDEGKKIGYDISVERLLLSRVAYKDKGRIITELKANGWSTEDIKVERVEIEQY
jgi:hypothetical protein